MDLNMKSETTKTLEKNIIYSQAYSLLRLLSDTIKSLKRKEDEGTFWGDRIFLMLTRVVVVKVNTMMKK